MSTGFHLNSVQESFTGDAGGAEWEGGRGQGVPLLCLPFCLTASLLVSVYAWPLHFLPDGSLDSGNITCSLWGSSLDLGTASTVAVK